MRKNIQLISLGITVGLFVVLNALLFLVDFAAERSSTIAMVLIIGIIASFIAVIVFLFLKNRRTSAIKL